MHHFFVKYIITYQNMMHGVFILSVFTLSVYYCFLYFRYILIKKKWKWIITNHECLISHRKHRKLYKSSFRIPYLPIKVLHSNHQVQLHQPLRLLLTTGRRNERLRLAHVRFRNNTPLLHRRRSNYRTMAREIIVGAIILFNGWWG